MVQNVPLPLKYPAEFDNGLWGGEAVVQGFIKRHQLRRRVPRFWFPTLQKAVLYSEILDKHFEVVVTARTLRLIDQHYGFDRYILEVHFPKYLYFFHFHNKLLFFRLHLRT